MDSKTPKNHLMILTYFVNQYPKSRSFIRREILALERLGYTIERFSLRTDKGEPVDPLDQSELDNTRYVLSEHPLKLILAFLRIFCSSPLSFYNSVKIAVNLGSRPDLGLTLHLIYLIEASKLPALFAEAVA